MASTSSTCQEVWCGNVTGAPMSSRLWWSVQQRRNAPTPARSLTLKPSPSMKNFWGVRVRGAEDDVAELLGAHPVRVADALRPLVQAGRVAGHVVRRLGGGCLDEGVLDDDHDAGAGRRVGADEAVRLQPVGDLEPGQVGGDPTEVVVVVRPQRHAGDAADRSPLDVQLPATLEGGHAAVAVVGEAELLVVGEHLGRVRHLVGEGAEPVQGHVVTTSRWSGGWCSSPMPSIVLTRSPGTR